MLFCVSFTLIVEKISLSNFKELKNHECTCTLKVVLLPGAGSGIGRAACRVFAREGAVIAAVDMDRESADTTIQSLPTSSPFDRTILQ